MWFTPDLKNVRPLSDFRYISLEGIHQRNKESFNTLKRLIKDRIDLVVITHHLPSRELITDTWKGHNSFGFTSDFDELFTFEGFWVFGHTHERQVKNINQIMFVCNPIGYPGEVKSKILDRDMVMIV
jgi:Icc-related predicted phosphoesterase